MRPRKGSLLSAERHNPGLKTFYEEFTLVDQTFRNALRNYLSSHTIPVSESTLQVGITGLRNYASDRTTLIPLVTYRLIASLVGLNTEIEPYKATGVYPGMLLAYFFDKSGVSMVNAVERLIPEFEEADEDIAYRLQQGKRRAVSCTMRDILTCRRGSVPVKMLRNYEGKVIDMFGTDGITPEQLREAFKGGRENLEFRINELVKKAKRNNPRPYEYDGGYTPRGDYFEGDTIMHNIFGRGEVIEVKPEGSDRYNPKKSIITVRFEDDKVGSKKLIVNPKS